MSSVGRNCATTLSFGGDHLHHQGTWPNTNVWLRDALEGLPEARLILGENVIRILGLDGATLVQVAARVDPAINDLTRGAPDLAADPALLAHLDDRGGYLKPADGDAKPPQVEGLVRQDLALAGVRV